MQALGVFDRVSYCFYEVRGRFEGPLKALGLLDRVFRGVRDFYAVRERFERSLEALDLFYRVSHCFRVSYDVWDRFE